MDNSGKTIARVTDNGFEQYGSFYVNASSEAALSAVYFTDEWQLSNSLRLDAGVRYERTHFSGKVEQTANDFSVKDGSSWAEQNVIYGTGHFRYYDHTFSEWALSVGANYTINNNLALYSRFSRGFRMPDFEQWIFSTDRGHSQYDFQSEAGLKIASSAFSLFATLFANRMNNIPFVDDIFENEQIVKQQRFASSKTYGLEIESVWGISHSLEVSITGTFQAPRLLNRQETWIDENTGAQKTLDLNGKTVRRIPQVLVDFMPSYSLERFHVYGNLQYIGRRFADDANTAVLPGYSIFGAGASYEMLKDRLTISAHVSNIMNTIGLTEGNPRIEQILAQRSSKIFMARPILGRTITAHTTVYF